MTLTQICSKCGKNGMECICENFHPNIPIIQGIDWGKDKDFTVATYPFDINELRAIYRTIERHYISYEDQEAHEVFNRIGKIVKDNELDRSNSSVKK